MNIKDSGFVVQVFLVKCECIQEMWIIESRLVYNMTFKNLPATKKIYNIESRLVYNMTFQNLSATKKNI